MRSIRCASKVNFSQELAAGFHIPFALSFLILRANNAGSSDMELIAQEGVKEGGREAGNAAGSQWGLAALMDEFAHAAIVTTLDGRMIHANQAARHELVRGRVIGLRQGTVQACRGDSDTDLHMALAQAADGKRSLVHLDANEGAAVPVAVVPLKPHAGEAPRVALIFARSAVCDSLMLGFFARKYNLTPTEQHVLTILCEGLSAPQVAGQLHVAVSTVRSHIRSLCAKTRTNGVRELVGRLAVLPPVAPAFPHEASRPAAH
jgi:DNA-binding CsgD family transcriptional regulator